jgi:hypothetical protein
LGTLAGDGHSVGLGNNDQGVITGLSIALDFQLDPRVRVARRRDDGP